MKRKMYFCSRNLSKQSSMKPKSLLLCGLLISAFSLSIKAQPNPSAPITVASITSVIDSYLSQDNDGGVTLEDIIQVIDEYLTSSVHKEWQLIIWEASGTKLCYNLEEKPKIMFEDTNLVFSTSNTTITFPINEIVKYTFAEKGYADLTPTSPQSISSKQDAIYIYRNDGLFNAFYNEEIDSITVSKLNTNGRIYSNYQSQVIWTADSVYRIPLNTIDSVGFCAPEKIYAPDVRQIDDLIPYITGVDGLILHLSSETPSNLVPQRNDILLYENFQHELFPLGFAGIVSKVTNYDVFCDSVGLKDVYEQIICVEKYRLVEEKNEFGETKKRLRPYSKRNSIPLDLDISAIGLDVDITLSTDSVFLPKDSTIQLSASATLHGHLSIVDISLIYKQNKSNPTYLECFITPYFKGTFSANLQAKLKSIEKDLFENEFEKFNHLRIPIPNTPFFGDIEIRPALKAEADVSLTSYVDVEFGYKLGYKNSNGKSETIHHPTHQIISRPDVTGKLSGRIFLGMVCNAGVKSVAEIISVVPGLEAGAEFSGEFDFFDLGQYNELRKKQIELNLVASALIKAECRFSKWLKIGGKFNLFSLKHHLNTWKLVPSFTQPIIDLTNHTKATISVVPGDKLLKSVRIGLGVWDKNGEMVYANYCPASYREINKWPLEKFQTTFTGLVPGAEYDVFPIVRFGGSQLIATPSSSFATVPNPPAEIINFEVLDATYSKDGFEYKGETYSYKFDCATTVELKNAEGVEDWGYVYKDPDGEIERISLKGFENPYRDTRYVYYRKRSKSTAMLYGYVKFYNDSTYYDAEPQDYDLIYGKQPTPGKIIDLGLSVKWAAWNIGANSPEEFGNYYAWGETEPKEEYTWKNYKYLYYNGGTPCSTIMSSIEGTSCDAAYMTWGGKWRMPAAYYFEELELRCKYEEIQYEGVDGALYTGPNGNSIFFPYTEKGKAYWTATDINGYYNDAAYVFKLLYPYRHNVCGCVNSGRPMCEGLPIRAIYY